MVKDQAKILVIEDEPPLRELYVELLTDSGYQVEFAVDGEAGLEKIQKGGWDLILLDVILPKIDGLNVLQQIQANPPITSNGPIVLLTALAQDSLVHKALNSGAAGYLVKPEITPEQVLQEVEKFLQQK
jgi:CheY-like chemotaxis protein